MDTAVSVHLQAMNTLTTTRHRVVCGITGMIDPLALLAYTQMPRYLTWHLKSLLAWLSHEHYSFTHPYTFHPLETFTLLSPHSYVCHMLLCNHTYLSVCLLVDH